MKPITPILLAGGSGTRLWPSSRKSYPKQFMSLTTNKTLFQQSAQRVVGCDGLKFNPQIIITNSNFRFIPEKPASDSYFRVVGEDFVPNQSLDFYIENELKKSVKVDSDGCCCDGSDHRR